jgi:hypothetical protein
MLAVATNQSGRRRRTSRSASAFAVKRLKYKFSEDEAILVSKNEINKRFVTGDSKRLNNAQKTYRKRMKERTY